MIFVVIETLRGRPYPMVLIELVVGLLDHLEQRWQDDKLYTSWRRMPRSQANEVTSFQQ